MLFDALSDFLRSLPPHLQKLWGPHIGTQLLWTDDIVEDKRKLRIPHDGDGKQGEPDFFDKEYFPSLDKLLGVGVNGWDWPDRRSRYVTFDLDSLLGHVKGLTDERIAEIIAILKTIPWVEVIRSKGGHGYHIRIYFDPFPFAFTHTEHARNAERALLFLSQVTGLDLKADVDCYGAMAWIWHRNTSPNGFELVKDATQTLDLSVTPELPSKKQDYTEFKKVKPGPKHKEIIAYLLAKGAYVDEEGRVHTHTTKVAQAVEDLGLHPGFKTNSDGTDPDHENCWLVCAPKGAFRVVRHTKGVKEHKSWETTKNGWTATWLNKPEKKPATDWPDVIVADALETDTFFYYRGIPYVEVMRRGHPETLIVDGEVYRRLLRIRHRAKYHKVLKAEWLKNAIDQLVAIALEESEEIPVYVRVAYVGGKIYIDLCDRDRTIIVIDRDGWHKAEDPPIHFLRTDKMLALPYPKKGGKLDQLKPFVNVHPDDWPLFIGALLGCFLPEGTFALISLIGGDGRCKSSQVLTILLLVDPNEVQGCAPPEKGEDLILAACQHYLLVFDNLSSILPWLSDNFCRLCSGAAIERRKLYQNAETSVFRAKRPIAITSIRDVITEPDLVSRALKFELPEVTKRKRESQLWADFEKVRPYILGALYDCISCGLRNLSTVEVTDLPRLADFAAWVQACEPATGLVETEDDKGIILQRYRAARESAVAEILGTGFAEGVIALAEKGFLGTGKEFVQQLDQLQSGRTDALPRIVPDKEIREIVGELRKLQTALESVGITVDFRPKSHGKRLIEIKRKRQTRNPAA